jgi:hypothetical protein
VHPPNTRKNGVALQPTNLAGLPKVLAIESIGRKQSNYSWKRGPQELAKRYHIWLFCLHTQKKSIKTALASSRVEAVPTTLMKSQHPKQKMLVAKILFNSVISTPGTRFMTMDTSNFYLMTPLLRPEYILQFNILIGLPDKIINQYKSKDKANKKGHTHHSITRGCTDYLSQAC